MIAIFYLTTYTLYDGESTRIILNRIPIVTAVYFIYISNPTPCGVDVSVASPYRGFSIRRKKSRLGTYRLKFRKNRFCLGRRIAPNGKQNRYNNTRPDKNRFTLFFFFKHYFRFHIFHSLDNSSVGSGLFD